MGKLILVVLLFVAVSGIVGWNLYTNRNQNNLAGQATISNQTPTTPVVTEPVNFTATFEIYTYGTKRVFTQTMYHDLSPDVFIQSQDPSVIYVRKVGITWTDFFETLPFSLSKECLTTGTKQTFCTTKTQKLRFFLNNIENPDTLDANIQAGDNLQVTYGN